MGCLSAVAARVAASPRLRVAGRLASAAICASLISACGGGGGGGGNGNGGGNGATSSGVSMSVSPLSVSVSASSGQPAPTAYVQVTVTGLQQGQQAYLEGGYSNHGIDTVTDSGGGSPLTVSIQFKVPASLGAGTYNDTLQLQVCYDQACKQQVTNSPQSVQVQYTVAASPVQVTALSPASAIASGPAFTLSVTGSGFSAQSLVQWNGSARNTSYVSSTELTAQITAADIATAGNVPVTVNDPAGVSNPVNFTIQPAMLGLTSISPTAVTAGGPSFMLTLLGSGFTNSSTVQWNGAARPTTLVSASELIAQIAAADIAAVGSAQVTVQDSSSAVGTTAAQTLQIVKRSIDATAFQMNPAHTGAVTFASVTFPAAATWSVDVGGKPSYALIVNGTVYVTVAISSGTSQLIALDQATGATVWGPVVIAGKANAAYDGGKIFVVSSPFATAATMEAFDAGSGAMLWSTLLAGQYAFSAAPTAANGMVYIGGAGSGGTLYALDQGTGAILWTQSVQNGDNSAPAVTADGVYVTYPCWTYDFRPATGESIWNNNTGCEGGGGATPVVANQLVYSPNGIAGYNGSVFQAETGANAGAFVADTPPAITTDTGYFLQSGTLRGVSLSNNTIKWSFAGDAQLAGAPIAVNQYVFIGSLSGNLYALDGSSGKQAWHVALGAPVGTGSVALQLAGLAAGDGLLIVPAGTKVTAYTLSSNP
ncbi:MAG TPA: PQQ-binding-like beta-propeller repeat protein [Steroidobacteraceae bacterium]|nr:PQQ-binding-like beta-propeller repeat protein [Steroidobacteraceae bacterium]